jgi:hypothetical protein
VIADADAQDRQENALVALAFDEAFQFVAVGEADVKVAVGR